MIIITLLDNKFYKEIIPYLKIKDSIIKKKFKMNKKALVIGAGIHGCTVAIELVKIGYEVTIAEKKDDILLGASFSTHNRVHLGYHYPRSRETRIECKQGYDYFIKNFKDCLIFPEFYYLIEKNNSKVNVREYKEAMEDTGLECNSIWPEDKLLNKELIADSFKVREGCFDIWKLKTLFSNVCHFCSMTPFHVKGDGTEKIAIAIYLRGMELFDEFLELWSKSKEWEKEVVSEEWINVNTFKDYLDAKTILK